MSKTFFKILLFQAFSAIFFSCGDKDAVPPFALPGGTEVQPAEVVRIDEMIAGYGDMDSASRAGLIASNYEMLLTYGRIADDVDTVDNVTMLSWSGSRVSEMFEPLVRKAFPSIEPVETAFGRILETARANDLELPADRFAATVWGRHKSIIINDSISTAFIALNHYLGADSPAYEGLPAYLRDLKTPAFVPVDMAEALVGTAYPYESEQGTVLSRMLYEGALAVAKRAMVPEASSAEILGLSEADYARIAENEGFMWKQLTGDGKIYSADASVHANLFDLRPVSSFISPDAPGRAVRFAGYRIVSEYLARNPQATLRYILSPEFYSDGIDALRLSGYNPR